MQTVKNIYQKWNNISLVKRIICGLITGILLGLAVPQASGISILGDLFIGALRGIAPVLVFFLVMSSLCHMEKGQKTNMKMIVILYMAGNVAAAACAVAASFLFPTSLALSQQVSASDAAAPGGMTEVMTNLLMNLVDNPLNAIINANYIGILAWAIIFGIALKSAAPETKNVLENISDAITMAVQWVISCAPFGIMGLIFTTISQQGLSVLLGYGRLLLVLLGTMAAVVFIVNPVIVFLFIRRNPYKLIFICLKESFITAFFTRSSAANIPVNMALCEKLGLDRDTYSISIPLGATINMAGAAITISTMALAAAHTLGVQVSAGSALIMCVVAAISAAGSSGVAGGSLLLIPLACSLFGIPDDISMQVVGIGFIIGVIQDSCETGINSSTDVLYTAIAELRDRRLHPENYAGKPPVHCG
ncbi:MAG TPA: serine/threonine transporter SstT [Candidatus Merdisoma merdipullorum]|nr:serine/threonine transporter SstT [Candidatus Merdisoma merdipullorum]